MAKVYDSPTANLFALLADEADQSQSKKKANASKGQGQELTPKERAAAKAVQDAERKKQQEAEKAKKAAEAERRKNIELIDDTGFAQQRHQRIKEARVHPTPAEGANKGPKGPKGEGKPKGQGKPFPKSEGSPKNVDKFNKGPKGEGKPVKTFTGKPDGKGPKGELKGDGKPKGDRAPRGREFDKHSQGVVSRKPQAKKGGHGKGNWDKAVPATEDATKETKETKETEEVTDATPAAEGEAKPETTEAAADQKGEEEEDKGITLEEYQKIQDEKKKELEAKLGVTVQPRTLSEDEKKALAKFTLVENTKDQKPVKAQNTTAAPKKQSKGPIVLEINPQLPPIHGSGERRKGGRFNKEGGNRGNNQNQQKKARVAKPAKLPRGGNFDAAFPALG